MAISIEPPAVRLGERRELTEVDEGGLGVAVSPLVPVTNRDPPERLSAIEVARLKEALDLARVELLIAVGVRGRDQIGPADDRAVVGGVDVMKGVPQLAGQLFGGEDLEVELGALFRTAADGPHVPDQVAGLHPLIEEDDPPGVERRARRPGRRGSVIATRGSRWPRQSRAVAGRGAPAANRR